MAPFRLPHAPGDVRFLEVRLRARWTAVSFISDKVGEKLRKEDVHYVDSLGNMYLRGNGLLLDVRGRRGPTTQPGAAGHPLRAFKSSGPKVIFALLADPELIAAPYREIARVSGVSRGTVH